MSFTRVVEENAGTVRIGPGYEQFAAIASTIVLAVGMLAGALLVRENHLFVLGLYGFALALFFTGYLLYKQQRTVEVNVEDACFYIFGRQAADVYCIPFFDIACLRVSCRASGRRIARQGAVATRYYLDIVRYDGGYETIEHSVTAFDVSQLSTKLAELTGIMLQDAAGLGIARKSLRAHSAALPEVPAAPSPHSIIRTRQGRKHYFCSWSLFPGIAVFGNMLCIGAALLVIGMAGVMELVVLKGNIPVGTVTALVAGFFAYQVVWRIFSGVLCTGYLGMEGDSVRAGTWCMQERQEHLLLPYYKAVGLRVVAPRFSYARLELIAASGDRYVLARILPGISPLTLGDLHWLNARFTKKLVSCKVPQGAKENTFRQ